MKKLFKFKIMGSSPPKLKTELEALLYNKLLESRNENEKRKNENDELHEMIIELKNQVKNLSDNMKKENSVNKNDNKCEDEMHYTDEEQLEYDTSEKTYNLAPDTEWIRVKNKNKKRKMDKSLSPVT